MPISIAKGINFVTTWLKLVCECQGPCAFSLHTEQNDGYEQISTNANNNDIEGDAITR